MASTRESIQATVSPFLRVVVPLFVMIDAPAQLFHRLGDQRPWLLIVFAGAWMLTAASALLRYGRGLYVPWSSCTARPLQTACLLALNAAPWLAVGFLNSPSTTLLALAAAIPSWICWLGAALAIVVTAWPMRRHCGVGQQLVFHPAGLRIQDRPITPSAHADALVCSHLQVSTS